MRWGEQSSSSVYDSVISTRIFKEVEVVEGDKGGGGDTDTLLFTPRSNATKRLGELLRYELFN